MADKTATSDKFSITLSDGTKVPELRTRSTYDLNDGDGVVRDARVDLLKQITKAEYDALPDNVKTTTVTPQTTALLGGFATRQNVLNYHAILASRPPGRGSDFVYNDEVLDKISLPKRTDLTDAFGPPIGPSLTFKKDIAEYNSSGGRNSPFTTVTDNAKRTIQRKEGLGEGSAKDQSGLGANTADSADATRSVQKATQALPEIPTDSITTANPIKEDYGGAVLQYPLEISNSQDVIKFTALKYSGLKFDGINSIDQLSSLSQQRTKELRPIKTSVFLPIQSKISDINTVEWGVGTINPLQAIGLGFLNNPKQSFDTLKETITGGGGNFLGAVGDSVKTLAFQEALGITGLLSRTAGAVFNPNTELLFRAPQLRPFNFSFFLAARSEKEAKEIRRIIRYFKQNMAVLESSNKLFLKAPNVFQIRYVYGNTNKDHPGLNRIKECALKSFNVDYNPDNTYMTFEDGTMTAYRITMQFQELLPVTDSDYEGLPDTTIGY